MSHYPNKFHTVPRWYPPARNIDTKSRTKHLRYSTSAHLRRPSAKNVHACSSFSLASLRSASYFCSNIHLQPIWCSPDNGAHSTYRIGHVRHSAPLHPLPSPVKNQNANFPFLLQMLDPASHYCSHTKKNPSTLCLLMTKERQI